MIKQINLVINGKGGVGKSFFATNFVQYLKDAGIVHRAIDSDHENSTLKRFHPAADFINVDSADRCKASKPDVPHPDLMRSWPTSLYGVLRKDIGQVAFQTRHDLVQSAQRDALLASFQAV